MEGTGDAGEEGSLLAVQTHAVVRDGTRDGNGEDGEEGEGHQADQG